MHDMLIAGFSAGGRHYCLTGGNLREDPPQKTPVPARPRRPGPTIRRHTTHAEIRFFCLRLAGCHAGMAAVWRRSSRLRQHVPAGRRGWPHATHAGVRPRRFHDGGPVARVADPKLRQDPWLFGPRVPWWRKQVCRPGRRNQRPAARARPRRGVGRRPPPEGLRLAGRAEAGAGPADSRARPKPAAPPPNRWGRAECRSRSRPQGAGASRRKPDAWRPRPPPRRRWRRSHSARAAERLR